MNNTYTTRSWDKNGNGSGKGIGPEKGLKVEPLINGVKTGQELWFSNASGRYEGGATGFSYGPGQQAEYWTSAPSGSDAYYLEFHAGATSGTLQNSCPKRFGFPIRCVR